MEAAFKCPGMKKAGKEFSIGRGLKKTGKMMLGALNVKTDQLRSPTWSLSSDAEGGEEEPMQLVVPPKKSNESDSAA